MNELLEAKAIVLSRLSNRGCDKCPLEIECSNTEARNGLTVCQEIRRDINGE